MEKTTDYIILNKDVEGNVVSIIHPTPESECRGFSIEDVAVLSVPGIREKLDRIMLGVSSLNELVSEKKVDVKVNKLVLIEEPVIDPDTDEQKITEAGVLVFRQNHVTKEVTEKQLVPDYSKVEAINEQVELGNITLNRTKYPDGTIGLYTEETPKAFLERFDISQLETEYNFRIILKDEVAGSLEFFQAFKDKGDSIEVNLEKAKLIKVERVRRERNDVLNKMDKEFIIAERNNDKGKIAKLEARRLVLLDVPQDIEARMSSINDINELRALEHEALI